MSDRVAELRFLVAASTTAEPPVRAVYLAQARARFVELAEELRALELVLVARERELVVVAQPKEQRELQGARRP